MPSVRYNDGAAMRTIVSLIDILLAIGLFPPADGALIERPPT